MISNFIAFSLLEVAIFLLVNAKGWKDSEQTRRLMSLVFTGWQFVKPYSATVMADDTDDLCVDVSFLSYWNNQLADLDVISYQRSVSC
jgi:hypothetical protein